MAALASSPYVIVYPWTNVSEEWILERKAQLSIQLKYQRSEAYRLESHPIFFKAQRGEATMKKWIAKVAEIKERYK